TGKRQRCNGELMATRDDFVRSLLNAPDDTYLRRVFADWLLERDDPSESMRQQVLAGTDLPEECVLTRERAGPPPEEYVRRRDLNPGEAGAWFFRQLDREQGHVVDDDDPDQLNDDAINICEVGAVLLDLLTDALVVVAVSGTPEENGFR